MDPEVDPSWVDPVWPTIYALQNKVASVIEKEKGVLVDSLCGTRVVVDPVEVGPICPTIQSPQIQEAWTNKIASTVFLLACGARWSIGWMIRTSHQWVDCWATLWAGPSGAHYPDSPAAAGVRLYLFIYSGNMIWVAELQIDPTGLAYSFKPLKM